MVTVSVPTQADHLERGTTAWEAIYEAEGPGLVRYVVRLVGPAEAADVVHDAFIRAMRAQRAPSRADEARPWLYRIVTNLALDVLRRRRRWRLVPWEGARLAPDMRDGDDDGLVRAALQSIPPDQAVALVLRLHERLSRAEIAALLGISESAVKGRLVRGRLRFVDAYRRLGGGS